MMELNRKTGHFHHQRRSTVPFAHSTRHKPRRWPLALRFSKGAIHRTIFFPVLFHALWAALICFIDRNMDGNLGLPPSIIPSLSIVVGLMLVFRNQTSYSRFSEGGDHLTIVITSIRNLTRMFLACSYNDSIPIPLTTNPQTPTPTTPRSPLQSCRADTERVVKILAAILYATKNHLRAEWGACIVPGAKVNASGHATSSAEYSDLLPPGLVGLDHQGVGIPLQLTFFVEQYIKRGLKRGWFSAPLASQMTAQLNTLVDAYGKMESIRLTPIPVAYLIHQKQVLALFGMVLPFPMVSDMGWWAVPIVTLVIFTLYGIEGIGSQLEDPFGHNRIDINMDAIVEDLREEIMVLVEEWKKIVDEEGEGEWFVAGGRWGGGPEIRVVSFED